MKITGVHLERYELKLTEPYTIAYETIDSVVNFVLILETDSGIRGMGCAAPDVEVTGESPQDVEFAFREYIHPFLEGNNPFYNTRIIHSLETAVKSSALAMVDMALFDLLSRWARVPLYHYLGAYRNKIPTSVTVGILPLKETMQKVNFLLESGFFIIKLKGGTNVEADVEKIKTIRKAYPDLMLRFDGNQGYSLAEARYFVRQIQHDNVEIIEQPVKVEQQDLMGILIKETTMPIMADESLKTLKDAFVLTSLGYSDMINIKIQKVGGIQNAKHINSVAKAARNEVMVGCFDESSLGISAGLHFALSRPNVAYADLDGHLDLVRDPFGGIFGLQNGVLIPGTVPGLGWTK